jgi:hypothetical protein
MIKFTATKLAATGKSGSREPDAEGYYTLLIGGLNIANSSGVYYMYEGSRRLFEESGVLMRRIKNGVLKGEMGHPEQESGMSDDDYIDRLLTIVDGNVCCHIKEIWLDVEFGKKHPEVNNPDMVAIFAKVRPSGPKGQYLKDALDNPSENVCFSIRSFADDTRSRGRTNRTLVEISTFDWVVEGGITVASQWDTIALEATALVDKETSVRQLERIVSKKCSWSNEGSNELALRCLEAVKPKVEIKTVSKSTMW